MVRILLIDDHPIVRSGIARMLERMPDIEICGEASDVHEARVCLETTSPDLVILDILLRQESGLEALKEFLAAYPKLHVLILSMMDETVYAERALRAGARGFVMKEQATEELQNAIETVLTGEVYLSASVAQKIAARSFNGRASEENDPKRELKNLTDRELHIFQLVGSGLPARTIASSLSLSPRTIEAHKQNIRNKLGCVTMEELNAQAVRYFGGTV